MSFIVDLDRDTCGSNPIDALIPDNNIIFKISKKNPYFQVIVDNFKVIIIKEEGDEVYFKIHSSG